MADPLVSYSPGTWSLVAREGRYALVAASPADEAVHLLWEAMAAGTTETLRAVATELPGARFCLVQVDDGRVFVAQDGLRLRLDDRPVEAGTLPVEVVLPDRDAVLVVRAEEAGMDLGIPLESGVVGASRLTLTVRQTTTSQQRISLVAGAGAGGTDADDPLEVSLEAVVRPAGLVPPQRDGAADDHDDAFAEDQEAGRPRPLVLATTCPQQHLNGPYAHSCRLCGLLIAAQEPRSVPQPSLGLLVLPDGTGIPLDRGAILGRAPRVPDGVTEDLHLINLSAFGRDVSRSHAEVVVRGWHVYVRDLGSANGTRIQDPFGEVTVVEPDEVVPLTPGSVLEIAGVTSMQFRVGG